MSNTIFTLAEDNVEPLIKETKKLVLTWKFLNRTSWIAVINKKVPPNIYIFFQNMTVHIPQKMLNGIISLFETKAFHVLKLHYYSQQWKKAGSGRSKHFPLLPYYFWHLQLDDGKTNQPAWHNKGSLFH